MDRITGRLDDRRGESRTRIARQRRHIRRPPARKPYLEPRVPKVFACHRTTAARDGCRGCRRGGGGSGGRSERGIRVDDRSALSERLFARGFFGAGFLVCFDLGANGCSGFRVLDLVCIRVIGRWWVRYIIGEAGEGGALPRRLCSASLTISFAFSSSLTLFRSYVTETRVSARKPGKEVG